MICPKCEKPIQFIEKVREDDTERVTNYNCEGCNMIIYLYEFFECPDLDPGCKVCSNLKLGEVTDGDENSNN